MDCFEAVQKSVFTTLTSNAAFSALVTGGLFYDEAPEGKQYPYAVYFLDESYDQHSQGQINSYRLQINSFSEEKPLRQIHDIKNVIRALINNNHLTLDGGFVNSIAPQIQTTTTFKNDIHNWQCTQSFTLKAE